MVLGFRVVSLTLGRRDDATLIRESLRQSIEASRKGEAGGVLDLLSRSVVVNGQEQSDSRGMIADYIRKQRPDVEVTNQNPIVTGDEARITSPVRLKVSLPVLGEHTVNLKDVVLTFHKETGRELLVIPVTKWRLAEISAPTGGLGDLGIE